MSYKVRSWSAHELLGIGVADICATCFPDGKHQGVPGQKVLGPGGVLHLENGCSEVRSRLPDLSRTAADLVAYDRGVSVRKTYWKFTEGKLQQRKCRAAEAAKGGYHNSPHRAVTQAAFKGEDIPWGYQHYLRDPHERSIYSS